MLQVRKSNPNKPLRIMAYGVEGVGKSTLGAKADNPVFISPEGGTDQLRGADGKPVNEVAVVNSWDTLIQALTDLEKEKHEFKSIVIDSADWVEALAHQKVIGLSGKTIITCNGGYGSGYRQSQNMHQDLIERLARLRENRGMNVIVTAHAHVKQVRDPGMPEDYDQFEIKCHEFVSAIWREWVDGLFFIRFRTYVKTGDTQKARAFGDSSRVLYAIKQPSFQAKNRYGMPMELEFKETFWNELKGYAKNGIVSESPEEILADIRSLRGLIKDENTLKIVDDTLSKTQATVEHLNPIRARMREITGEKA